MDFRSDINGLRAIAVIVVVLFHFSISGFSGGFIGVDIFFVISGFLMTKIISARLNKNEFSVIDFYLARGRRIIPPLAILCLAVLVVGWLLLSPIEYKSLSKHVVASITFLSNIIYQNEAGYFDLDSSYKILLHTWSLSAEWQFYMLYPVIFLIFRKHLLKAIIASTIISFAASLYYSFHNPSISYFLFYCRAWEMLAGGLVYFLQSKTNNTNKSIMYLGLAILLISLITIDKDTVWPGYMALLPIIGTALIIYSNVQDSKLFNNKVVSYIGKSSYSIYLWHWPVFAFMNISGVEWSLVTQAIGVLLSLLLGFISYELIEKKVNIRIKNFKGIIAFSIIVALTSSPALAIYFKNGVYNRVSDEVIHVESTSLERNSFNEKCLIKTGSELNPCFIGRKDSSQDPSIIILGDSHSDATLTAVIASLPRENNGVLFLGYQNCLPVPKVNIYSETKGFACGEYNKKVHQYLSNNFLSTPIIIISRTSAYIYGTKEGETKETVNPLAWFEARPQSINKEYLNRFGNEYKKALCSYKTESRQVYVTYPYPGFSYDVPRRLARDLMQHKPIQQLAIDRSTYENRNKFVRAQINEASENCGIKIIDPAKVYCDAKKCYGNDDRHSYYYDGTHLNEYGNKKMIPLLKGIFM